MKQTGGHGNQVKYCMYCVKLAWVPGSIRNKDLTVFTSRSFEVNSKNSAWGCGDKTSEEMPHDLCQSKTPDSFVFTNCL